jgi:hypothetical protein
MPHGDLYACLNSRHEANDRRVVSFPSSSFLLFKKLQAEFFLKKSDIASFHEELSRQFNFNPYYQ